MYSASSRRCPRSDFPFLPRTFQYSVLCGTSPTSLGSGGMSVRTLTALSLASIALLAPACGPSTDPCTLLTNDELTQIFGSAHAITSSKGFVTGGDQACTCPCTARSW